MTFRFSRRDHDYLLRCLETLRAKPDDPGLRAEVRALGALIEIAMREAFGLALVDDRWGDAERPDGDWLTVVELALRSPRFVDAYPFGPEHWTRGDKIFAAQIVDAMRAAGSVKTNRKACDAIGASYGISGNAVEHHVHVGRRLLGIKRRRGRPRS